MDYVNMFRCVRPSASAVSSSSGPPRKQASPTGYIRETWLHLFCSSSGYPFFCFFLISLASSRRSPCRSPHMSAVHWQHDAGGEDVPVAVHRVQVLQHLRHLRERCTYDVGDGRALRDVRVRIIRPDRRLNLLWSALNSTCFLFNVVTFPPSAFSLSEAIHYTDFEVTICDKQIRYSRWFSPQKSTRW